MEKCIGLKQNPIHANMGCIASKSSRRSKTKTGGQRRTAGLLDCCLPNCCKKLLRNKSVEEEIDKINKYFKDEKDKARLKKMKQERISMNKNAAENNMDSVHGTKK